MQKKRSAARKRKCAAICSPGNNNTQRGNHVTCHAPQQDGHEGQTDSRTPRQLDKLACINMNTMRNVCECVCACLRVYECAVFAIHRRHFYKNFNPLMAAISAISILLTANLQYLHGAFAEGRRTSMCVIKARHCNESFAYNPHGTTLNECIQLGQSARECACQMPKLKPWRPVRCKPKLKRFFGE